MKKTRIKQFITVIITVLTAIQIQAESLINESFLKTINTDGDETSCAVTGDSRYFIFSRKVKGGSNSDLYYTEFKNKKWTEAKPAAVLNSDSDEISPYISSDGKFILFSSNRPGSLKRMSADKPSYDIYFSEKSGDDWSKPELLFGAVNTADDEINPFIIKDGTTLYFTRSSFSDSSKTTIVRVSNSNDSWEDVRTAGISKNSTVNIYMYKKSAFKSGSFASAFRRDDPANRDIFFIDDSDNEIRELTGLKEPVNSKLDEISITELDGDSIIVASNNNGMGGSYDFFLKKTGKILAGTVPEHFTLRINSADYKKNDDIRIRILYFNSLGKNSWPVRFETMAPDQSGVIKIKADSDIKRILAIPAEAGVKTFAVEFFTGKNMVHPAEIKIEPSIETEFAPEYVYFNFNSSEIKLNHVPYLHSLIEYLRKNESTLLILDGYSDGIGSYRANIDISLRRAERVKDYLIKSGIKKERIQTRGSGYRKDRKTDTAQYNRRVESTIINQ